MPIIVYVLQMLRENNRQLEDENAELKLLISMNTRTSTDKVSSFSSSSSAILDR